MTKTYEITTPQTKYDITLLGLYGEDYINHIKEGSIYAANFPGNHPSILGTHHNKGSFMTTVPVLIKITKVCEVYAAFVLYDYPDVPEYTFSLKSIMAESLIEIL